MASEKLRQREVHKYYQSWLDSSIGLDSDPFSRHSRHNVDRSTINISKDKALNAFAQLGCLKLDVKRCIVTLISTDQQYILAEATKSFSLVSGDGDSTRQDQIWFGNASLPRSQGISGDALTPPDYTAVGIDASTYTAPALVVNDITAHHAYSSRGYAGLGVTFYGGVPIRTESGLPIGAYTVTDDKPRDGLNPGELKFMHDMAATVMHHLKIVNDQAARFRGETMVLGLGKFISGASALQNDTAALDTKLSQSNPSDWNLTTDDRVRVFKGIDITTATPANFKSMKEAKQDESVELLNQSSMNHSLSPPNRDVISTSNQTRHPMDSEQSWQGREVKFQQPLASTAVQSIPLARPQSTPDSIFSRAAKILQACVSADGVLFFHVNSSNDTKQHATSSSGLEANGDRTDFSLIQQSTKPGFGRSQTLKSVEVDSFLSSGISDESDTGSPGEDGEKMCRLLGYASLESSQNTSHSDIPANIRLKDRTLNKLIKLYPQGKLFTPHVGNSMSGSDGERLTEDASGDSDAANPNRLSGSTRLKRLPRAIADELDRLVSHAQNVVWLPLWDFTRQCWSAGLFLWSKRVDRLIAAQEDLIYLKAFANSIMVEVARRDAAVADTAKSTFIANISHELRTPLHGIIGNLDILEDTKLDEFQQSLATAIEVCGRTLLDTIDHVLEYSKINQLSKKRRNWNQFGLEPPSSRDVTSPYNTAASVAEEDFDLAAIVEEAIEAAYASHTFQSMGRTKLRTRSITDEKEVVDHLASASKLRDVQIVMCLEHRRNWWVHSQPSAIRRVVTNLFANALKYTNSGMIQVTLSTRGSTQARSTASAISVLLSIKDTGKGMSTDFVRNRAFVPFSQESPFSTGTGLGLSIVQQIVRSLGGKVELESEQGVGTELKVSLRLPVAMPEMSQLPQSKFPHFTSSLGHRSERSMRIFSEETIEPDHAARGFTSVTSSLALMAKEWFDIIIVEPGSPVNPDFVFYRTPPNPEHLQETLKLFSNTLDLRVIVLAANMIDKARLIDGYSELTRQTGLHIDVVSQPLGPFKLRKPMLDQASQFNEGQTKSRAGGVSDDIEMSNSPYVSAEERSPREDHSNLTDENGHVTGNIERRPRHNSDDSRERSRHSLESMSSETEQVKQVDAETVNHLSNNTTSRTAIHRAISTDSSLLGPLTSPVSSHMSKSMSKSFSGASSAIDIEDRLRVLLVDDNDINLSLLKTCMRRAHIPFDFATDGLQATLAFENASHSQCPFSHVLMDISMPVMDGIQATREIRAFERRQHGISRASSRNTESTSPPVPIADLDTTNTDISLGSQRTIIIALSGVAAGATQQEMIEAGADLFLPKPVKMKELVSMLRSWNTVIAQ